MKSIGLGNICYKNAGIENCIMDKAVLFFD